MLIKMLKNHADEDGVVLMADHYYDIVDDDLLERLMDDRGAGDCCEPVKSMPQGKTFTIVDGATTRDSKKGQWQEAMRNQEQDKALNGQVTGRPQDNQPLGKPAEQNDKNPDNATLPKPAGGEGGTPVPGVSSSTPEDDRRAGKAGVTAQSDQANKDRENPNQPQNRPQGGPNGKEGNKMTAENHQAPKYPQGATEEQKKQIDKEHEDHQKAVEKQQHDQAKAAKEAERQQKEAAKQADQAANPEGHKAKPHAASAPKAANMEGKHEAEGHNNPSGNMPNPAGSKSRTIGPDGERPVSEKPEGEKAVDTSPDAGTKKPGDKPAAGSKPGKK